ncbi:MAG TPA: hypothetical protein VHN59_09720 [Chitinophagaceae bacterium]|nr:hypothetical protein [Chitinophagaceae bacterium]
MISGINKNMRQLFIIIIFLLPLTFYGQDKEIEAQVHYLQAEDLYTQSTFKSRDSALKELLSAEVILGNTNPKILFLKIKTLHYLYPDHYPYLFGMDTCLKKFFSVVDAKNYPTEKYAEIIVCKNRFKAFSDSLGQRGEKFITKDYSGIPYAKLLGRLLGDNPDPPKMAPVNFEKESDIEEFTLASPEFKYRGRYYFGILPQNGSGFLYGIIKRRLIIDDDGTDNSGFKYFNYQVISLNSKETPRALDCFITWDAGAFKRLGPDYLAYTFRTKISDNAFLIVLSSENPGPLTLSMGIHFDGKEYGLAEYFTDKRLKQLHCRVMKSCPE